MYSSASPRSQSSIRMYWYRPRSFGCFGALLTRGDMYFSPLGHLLSSDPQKVAGGLNGQENAPLVTTKFGQTPRRTSELSMTETASSVPTTLISPLSFRTLISLRRAEDRLGPRQRIERNVRFEYLHDGYRFFRSMDVVIDLEN